MGKNFDELAKALATGTSRRVALRRFIGGVAGAALAGLTTGRTSQAAAQGMRRQCEEFCESLSQPARHSCKAYVDTCRSGCVVVQSMPVCL